MKEYSNIDEYIKNYPEEVAAKLTEIRNAIKSLAPKAEEAIKYGIPTFVYKGNLVHFAAYKSHIGFYPGPSGLLAFKEEIEKYPNSKGTVQFPLDKKLPIALIKKIVKFRIAENSAKTTLKKKK